MIKFVASLEPRDGKWLLDLSRERLRQLKYRTHIDELTNAIGERRIRDVVDLLSLYEQESGWDYALDCLMKSQNAEYESPLSTWGKSVPLEPLKYREVVFELFGCSGLEAIPLSHSELFDPLRDAPSFSSATTLFQKSAISSVRTLLERGNFLFLQLDEFPNYPRDLLELMRSSLDRQLLQIVLPRIDSLIDITALWHTELGRRVLSNLGIMGTRISDSQLDVVLSVLPVLPSIRDAIASKIAHTASTEWDSTQVFPDYNSLLAATINHDLLHLRHLGSKYGISTVNMITRNALDTYCNEETPEIYRLLLDCLNSHLAIRHVDSIPIFDEIISFGISRLILLAITALGHYYHKSSVITLCEHICTTKQKTHLESMKDSIFHIGKKFPELPLVLNEFLDHAPCLHHSRLARLVKRLPKYK